MCPCRSVAATVQLQWSCSGDANANRFWEMLCDWKGHLTARLPISCEAAPSWGAPSLRRQCLSRTYVRKARIGSKKSFDYGNNKSTITPCFQRFLRLHQNQRKETKEARKLKGDNEHVCTATATAHSAQRVMPHSSQHAHSCRCERGALDKRHQAGTATGRRWSSGTERREGQAASALARGRATHGMGGKGERRGRNV